MLTDLIFTTDKTRLIKQGFFWVTIWNNLFFWWDNGEFL